MANWDLSSEDVYGAVAVVNFALDSGCTVPKLEAVLLTWGFSHRIRLLGSTR